MGLINRWRRSRAIATSATLAAVAATLVAAGSASASSGTYLVGGVFGSTGAYGITGIDQSEGAKVAIDYINAHGGLLGHKLKFVWYNDGASATVAAEDYRRLVSDGAIFISGSGDAGPATAEAADRYKVPVTGIIDDGGPTIYPNGPGTAPLPWVFDTNINNYAQGTKFAQYALQHCKGGLALLHDSTSSGTGASQAEEGVYKTAGKKLALDDTITENWGTSATVSLTSEIQKVKSSGATCVDVWLTDQDEAAFAQQATALGDHFTMMGSDETNATDTYVQLAGPLADGMIAPDLTGVLRPTAEGKFWQKQLAKAYPGKDPGLYALTTIDGIMMAAQAIKNGKSVKPDAIRNGLNNLHSYKGALGTVGFTAKNHQTIGAAQLTLVQWSSSAKAWVPIK